MGAVYAATQLRLSKRVAVKVMARELAANPEALAFRGIGHPDVKPGILEVGILLKTRCALGQ